MVNPTKLLTSWSMTATRLLLDMLAALYRLCRRRASPHFSGNLPCTSVTASGCEGAERRSYTRALDNPSAMPTASYCQSTTRWSGRRPQGSSHTFDLTVQYMRIGQALRQNELYVDDEEQQLAQQHEIVLHQADLEPQCTMQCMQVDCRSLRNTLTATSPDGLQLRDTSLQHSLFRRPKLVPDICPPSPGIRLRLQRLQLHEPRRRRRR